MECSKCGCPLIEGYSRFCPECGTPVEVIEENYEAVEVKESSGIAQKVILTVLLALSVFAIFLPFFQVAKDSVNSISVAGLSFGFAKLGKVKLGAFPYFLPLFTLPHIASIIVLYIKKLNIHTKYCTVGIIELVFSIIYMAIWAMIMIASSVIKYFSYRGGYGIGIVVCIVLALLASFLCISFSASTKRDDGSRIIKWFKAVNLVQIILTLGIMGLYAFIFITNPIIFKDYLFSATKIAALVLLLVVSVLMFSEKFRNWPLYVLYVIISTVANVFMYINSSFIIKNVLSDDAFKIYDLIKPYFFVFGVFAAVCFIYSVSMCIWSYKINKKVL